MRRHIGTGVQFSLLVGMFGVLLSGAQGCANGDTKQGDSNNVETSTGGESSSSGGVSSQGGTAVVDTTAQGGDTSLGGAPQGGTGNELGGSDNGGESNTGGVESTIATGGSEGGGEPSTGGTDGEGMGGSTDNIGGSTTEVGGAATGGAPPVDCQTSLECSTATDNRTVCDNGNGYCVQCTIADDCTANLNIGPNHDCVANQCIAFTPCANTDDCTSGVCDTAMGRCVGCSADGDCGSGMICRSQTCRTACNSDVTCTQDGLLCNRTLGVCVECGVTNQSPCASGNFCSPDGLCVPPVCTAGNRTCVDDGIATCVRNGSGYGTARLCPDGATCQEQSGTPACYDADGGVVQNCFVAGDPCEEITELYDTQVVDGMGDDFCGVPSAILDKDHNQGVLSWHVTPPEIANIQVAWSSAGLHVFVDVEDASVQTVEMADPAQSINRAYQGDSIEIMFSSGPNVTGLTGTDNNTTHVQIPASGPAVTIKTSNDGGASQGTATALPTAQYAQKKTLTGYAIEALLPWPGGTPNAGTNIRFDMTLNSADSDYSSVDDMRDGSLTYYLGDVQDTTCQSNDGTVPYCDNRTWCSTPLK